MRTFRRIALVVGMVVVVLALGGWIGLRAYLSSSKARTLAADKLSAMVGLPVEVEHLSVGMASSSLSFRVVEPAADGRPAEELLRVDSVSADVSLVDLAGGHAAPTDVTVHGLALTLHFDRDGKLLTKMPKSSGGGETHVPVVHADGVTLTLKQDGRPDFVLSNATLAVTPDGDKVGVRGSVDDPNWAKWEVTGEADAKAGTGSVELATAAGPLKMDLLRSIPFIPESTWKAITATGTTPARITLASGSDKKFRYDVVLKPTGAADVTLPDIEATLTKVAGTFDIHDAKVQMTDCSAALADGSVRVSGTLDFAAEPSDLRLNVAVAGADMQKLPAAWGLPQKLEGKLRGKADLELKVQKDGKMEPRGGGSAVVEGAKWNGLPVEIGLRLHGNGKQYRFETADQPAGVTNTKSSRQPPVRREVTRTGQSRAARRQAPQPPAPAAPPAAQAPKDDNAPSTIDANVALRDVDVAELLKRLDVKIPYRLGGKVTVQARVTIPLARADNTRSYRVVGTLTSPEARFEEMVVHDLTARVEYANGTLKLTELRGTIPTPGGTGSPGVFSGTASAAVDPRGELSAALSLDRIPLGEVAKAVPGGLAVSGIVNGHADFRAPLDRLTDAATWVGSADVAADELGLFGRTVRGASAKLRVERGTATLTPVRAVVEGLPVTADATLGLAKPYKFDGTLRTTPLDVASLRKLVPELSLPFALEGRLSTTAKVGGTISPFAIDASGAATATELTIGPSTGNKLSFKWALDTDRLRVTDLAADLFGGTVAGSADVPLDTTKAGKFDVSFKNLDAGQATKVVPDLPVRVTGQVSGKFDGEVPAAKPGQARNVVANLDLTAPKLTVQGIPAERLTGKVGLADRGVDYALQGHALGGTFDIKGRYPTRRQAAPPRPAGDRGSLNLRGIDLRYLAQVFKVEALRPLRGRVDLALSFAEDFSDGTGRLAVNGLGWGNDIIADQLAGAIQVRNGTLTLDNFGGPFAGGEFRARARVEMASPRRNFVVLTIDRADAKQLFAPAPSLADSATGQVSVVFRGRLGTDTRGTGTLSFDRGTLLGLDASNLRLPFDLAAGTGGGGELTVRDAAADVGEGRLRAQATYTWGVSSRLSGQVRFTRVRLRNVLARSGESSLFGNGRITGRFDFGGSDVRSAADVSGTLTATLNQTSVQEIPIISLVTPYLSTATGIGTFNSGEVRGRLSNGVFRLDRLALASSSAQLFASGSITLAGRLDLDVVARTGQFGLSDRGLRLLGLGLPTIGPIPIGLIRDVSDFLSNQTVRLRVTGTISQPSVQVNVAALLSEEAVRFFLNRYLPGAGALYSGEPFGE